ncbi:nitroreductase/quinone reductase family protein [Rhizohabitans arisaemae]|uniref:nitroreductase/quinone reductase family protein n=1 Tax=Rhizohabitans arisaemae TaxID=2720610 RepID=UPI0024B27D9B|nr:nitroreductase/quinone reductase family protein [Rhizohabitans arisaemae]
MGPGRSGEKALWWREAVDVHPDHADYQRGTDRRIPVPVGADAPAGTAPRAADAHRRNIDLADRFDTRDLDRRRARTFAVAGASNRP